jgi:hypothetical protein
MDVRGLSIALLVGLVGCRLSWTPHMGVPARQSNVTTLALFAKDDAARGLAKEVLSRDGHITLIEGDVPDSEQCGWAAAHGAQMYAVAYVDAGYDSTFKCTKTEGGIFSKHEECVDGYETDKHTSASYSLTTYDATTCKEIPRLTARFSATALGEEEQSKPEALATLAQRVRAKSEQLPDQLTLDAQGRLVGDAHDGFYAVFRAGQYRGYVRRDGEDLTPMYCCFEPQPGDALVERGRRKFLELAIDATASRTDGQFAIGGGAHLRHYKLDGGFQFGFGADGLVAAGDRTLKIVTAELGWGVPIAPGFVASANVGVGWTVHYDGDNIKSATESALTPMLRVQTFLTTFVFVSMEAGVLFAGGPAPISRITAGFDL